MTLIGNVPVFNKTCFLVIVVSCHFLVDPHILSIPTRVICVSSRPKVIIVGILTLMNMINFILEFYIF